MSRSILLKRVAVVGSGFIVATVWMVCLAEAAGTGTGDTRLPDQSPTLNRILVNWKARQEHFQSFHFTWDSRLRAPKGALFSDPRRPRQVTLISREAQVDIPHSEFWAEGDDRLRTEYSMPEYDGHRLAIGTRYRGTFDGKTDATLEFPRDGGPRGTIWNDKYDHESRASLVRPLWLGCQPASWHATGTQPELFRVVTERAIIENVRYVKIEKRSPKFLNHVEACWVDPARDDVIVRWEITGGMSLFWASIEYRKDNKHGWVPCRWKSNLWGNREASAAMIEATVTNYAINEKYPAGIFAPNFPSDTNISGGLE
jgi:hypothetical protein